MTERSPAADSEPPLTDPLLRGGALDGVAMLVAGAGPLGAAVAQRCGALGADIATLAGDELDGDERELAARAGATDVLVNDGAALFAAGGLRACLDGAWAATHAVANTALIARGGRIVSIAPPPGAGAHAGAARAGLENLARTLSTEWARHAIVTTTIAPADSTSGEQVAGLVAFLASAAGGYYSGCLFTLG